MNREMARIIDAGVENLQKLKLSRGVINSVASHAVPAVVEHKVQPVGHVQCVLAVLVLGRGQLDLAGRGRQLVRVVLGEGGDGLDLGQLDGVLGVGDGVHGHGVCEFADHVEEAGLGAAVIGVEHGVARAGAGLGLDGGDDGGGLRAVWGGLEDADFVSAQVGDQDVFARWVEKGLVRVRCVLLGTGPWGVVEDPVFEPGEFTGFGVGGIG